MVEAIAFFLVLAVLASAALAVATFIAVISLLALKKLKNRAKTVVAEHQFLADIAELRDLAKES